MTLATVEKARNEAGRFIDKVNAAFNIIVTTQSRDWPVTGTKETGAVRRASLDLTRALAKMRRA